MSVEEISVGGQHHQYERAEVRWNTDGDRHGRGRATAHGVVKLPNRRNSLPNAGGRWRLLSDRIPVWSARSTAMLFLLRKKR